MSKYINCFQINRRYEYCYGLSDKNDENELQLKCKHCPFRIE